MDLSTWIQSPSDWGMLFLSATLIGMSKTGIQGISLLAVPLMAIAAYVLKLPPIWVYFVMTLDEFEKMPIVFIHYFKFKWLKNITRDRRELEAS